MLTQLVKTIKRLVANVTHKWVEVGLVIVHARLSLIHARYVTLSNKVVIIIICHSLPPIEDVSVFTVCHWSSWGGAHHGL
jgi:hypothetical protein